MSAIGKLFGLGIDAVDEAITSVRKGGGRGTTYDQNIGEYVPSEVMKPEIVIGPKGLKNLAMSGRITDEEFDTLQENSKLARDMFNRGSSNDDIIARTGFMFDEKGTLQKEIDDMQSSLLVDPSEVKTTKEYRLNDIFEHPDFFAAYPQFKDIKVQFFNGNNPKDKGSFIPSKNLLKINKNRTEFIDNENPEQVISTILHESQHAIQVAEKFIAGGSWKQFIKGDPNTASDKERKEAFRKYLSIFGEAQARNVELRYLLEYLSQKKNFQNLLKGKNFWETMLKDAQSVEAGLRMGELSDEAGTVFDFRSQQAPTNDLTYKDPFEDTTQGL